MKKTYSAPEISVVLFENEDIVTTSSGIISAVNRDGFTPGDIESNFTDWLNQL